MKASDEFERRLSLPVLHLMLNNETVDRENNVESRLLEKDYNLGRRLTISAPSLKGFFPVFRNEFLVSQPSATRSNSFNQNNAFWLKEGKLPMTQSISVSRGPADPEGSAGAPIGIKNFENVEMAQTSRSSTSKARQKKFHRHFKQVDVKEKVLNYYSCALVGDILLQGHLYITENFFAFYSNVFGYVTKLLIPTVDVLKISKEKTARIIPNAVGIFTEDEKHVFGSLLSRDSTYKFMMEVWKNANSCQNLMNLSPPEILKPEASDEDSTGSSGNEEPSSFTANLTSCATQQISFRNLFSNVNKNATRTVLRMKSVDRKRYSIKTMVISAILVALLPFLFASAGYLCYRIISIQNYLTFKDLNFRPQSDVYEDILKLQSKLHSTSADKIEEFLSVNLKQISKIRLSLEALSALILSNDGDLKNSNFYGENAKELETKKVIQEALVGKTSSDH